jgi:hypothetical protein
MPRNKIAEKARDKATPKPAPDTNAAPSAAQLTEGVDVNTPEALLAAAQPLSTTDRAKLTNEEVHRGMVEACARYQSATIEVFQYTCNKLQLSLAELAAWATEISDRFNIPGVAVKDRPNGQPTVHAYWRSIGYKPSTVRGWVHRYRKKFLAGKSEMWEMFGVSEPTDYDLLSEATHELAKVEREGGNVKKAVEECVELAGPLLGLEQSIELPENPDNLQVLTKHLVNLVESFFKDPSTPMPMPKKIKVCIVNINADFFIEAAEHKKPPASAVPDSKEQRDGTK